MINKDALYGTGNSIFYNNLYEKIAWEERMNVSVLNITESLGYTP